MTESNKNLGFTDAELKQLAYNFQHGDLAQISKEGFAALGDYYIQLVEKSTKANDCGLEIGSLTHGLCHMYEDGGMSNELARPVGNILLDKLIEKAEQGYFSHANRSIDGYWQSVKNNPDAWQGLKAVLEKHPNYVFGQKYLGYMKGKAPEDAKVLAQRYLKAPDMLFVTTNMVDIDGTLIQKGKANCALIRSLMSIERCFGDVAIYTGGNPVIQKRILAKAIAEQILDKYCFVKEDFSVKDIFNMYLQDNEQNMALRDDLLEKMYGSLYSFFITKFNIQTEQEWKKFAYSNLDLVNKMFYEAKYILEFLNRLMSKGDKQIKIYPKKAFTQDNICLAGTVIDDTQPAAQGIKSLTLAVLEPRESSFWKTDASYTANDLNIPQERKITAEQAFAMYQQKHKEDVVDDVLLDKLIDAEETATSVKELQEKINNIVREAKKEPLQYK